MGSKQEQSPSGCLASPDWGQGECQGRQLPLIEDTNVQGRAGGVPRLIPLGLTWSLRQDSPHDPTYGEVH